MKLRTAIAPSLFALLLVGLTGSGCMRLDEPEAFRCSSYHDCLAGERCGSGGWCLEAGQCDSHSDCTETQRCEGGQCTFAECTSTDAGACGRYGCDIDERECYTSCLSGTCHPDSVCDQGVCRAPLNLPHGAACTTPRDCMSMRCCSAFGTSTRTCGTCLN